MIETAAASPAERRRCLLELGAALLAGGEPVTDVEETLRGIGRVFGDPDVRVTAAPNGLFLGLDPDAALGYEHAAASLRFDQTADVLTLLRDLGEGRAGAAEGLARLAAIRSSLPAYPQWLADLGCLAVGAGLALVLQPAPANILGAVAGSVVLTVLFVLARRVGVVRTVLPFVAPLVVGCVLLAAARHGLLDGPVRTIVASVALLLPGGAMVTGLSEIASGAVVSGVSRLTASIVSFGLFTTGLLAAAQIMGATQADLTNVRVEVLGPWAPWAGLVVLWVGVAVNVHARLRDTPWILAVMLLTFLVQTTVSAAGNVALGSFAGACVAGLAATLLQRLPGGPFFLTVFLPSFWVLTPGSLGLLSTVELATDVDAGVHSVLGAGLAVLAVAFGTLVGTAVGRVRLPGRPPAEPA